MRMSLRMTARTLTSLCSRGHLALHDAAWADSFGRRKLVTPHRTMLALAMFVGRNLKCSAAILKLTDPVKGH